ncbi:MAG: hypothetical protein IJE97_15100, partial [Thermoguttaceae bacterium]|nr:hypothetical protein [Thermoguttaceae bacterium]
MKSNFSEQELKERTLELLYGLLDENEAEELRRLIASDATAARIFDEARETADRFARAARWEEAPETEVDETAEKNVAVEAAPFDGGASLAFDSALIAGDAFSANVDGEPAKTPNVPETEGESSGSNRKRAKRRLKLLRKLKTASKNERSDNDVNVGKRGGLGKERRRKKAGRPANVARPATASRFRFGSKGRVDGESGWATVGRTASGEGGRRSAARRFWARVPKPTLFQNLIIALAIVALSTAVGFWAQESALQARFRDDFRIQIAAPRTLARGASQTILATTTAPNGKPRRVPIRFAFSDAETGTPLLAHTESGDASGVARFKIPDVSDFPARTRLTISAGEQEKETFETILTVVGAPKQNVGASAAARFAALETVEENGVETTPAKKARTQKKATNERASFYSRGVAPSAAKNERAQEADARYWRLTDSGAPTKPDNSAMGMSATTASEARNAASSTPDGKMGMMGGMGASMGASMSASPTPDDKAAIMGTMGMTGEMNALSRAEKVVADASPTSAPLAFDESAPTDDFGRAVASFYSRAGDAESNDAVEFNFSDETPVAPVAPEKRALDVRVYPVGGRLVAGRENVVWFECVDEAGRPVVGEFALNDSEGRVATAKTSEGGVGSLRWTPDVDETYSLETAFDGKIAKVVESSKNGKTVETVKNGKASGDEERVAAEEAAPGAVALNVAVEDLGAPEPTFETFRFPAPTPTDERVAFSVPSPILGNGKNVELEIWAEKEIPLAATVEKNGVALAQLVWTAKKGRRRVVVPLDADVSGALNVSLWNCA